MKKKILVLLLLAALLAGCTSAPADAGDEGGGDGTLPGAEEIYPSVMVNGTVYQWTGSGEREAYLPAGFEYEADLQHIEGDVLSEDYQFISVFDAAGEIYTNPEEPDMVYLKLTTDWFEEHYIKFTLEGPAASPGQ